MALDQTSDGDDEWADELPLRPAPSGFREAARARARDVRHGGGDVEGLAVTLAPGSRARFCRAPLAGMEVVVRARPKRCFAGFRASFCFSFGQSVAGKQAGQNEKQNDNETRKHR